MLAVGVRDQGQGGHRWPQPRVQISAGTPPVRSLKSVGTVGRDRHRNHFQGAEHGSHLGEPSFPAGHQSRGRGKELMQPPRPGDSRVTHEQHHPVAGHAAELRQAPCPVTPVMDGQHPHRGAEGAIAERQRLGNPPSPLAPILVAAAQASPPTARPRRPAGPAARMSQSLHPRSARAMRRPALLTGRRRSAGPPGDHGDNDPRSGHRRELQRRTRCHANTGDHGMPFPEPGSP